jgi:prophage regulatory protein
MSQRIQRLPAVKFESGLSRSTIYLRIAQGLWTKPVSLGGRAKGWPSGDAAAINAARIAGNSESEICELVLKLEAARKTVYKTIIDNSDTSHKKVARSKIVGER